MEPDGLHGRARVRILGVRDGAAGLVAAGFLSEGGEETSSRGNEMAAEPKTRPTDVPVADFIALDWAATPELAWRMERCQGLAERLFALMMLGDERCVVATHVMGAVAFVR